MSSVLTRSYVTLNGIPIRLSLKSWYGTFMIKMAVKSPAGELKMRAGLYGEISYLNQLNLWRPVQNVPYAIVPKSIFGGSPRHVVLENEDQADFYQFFKDAAFKLLDKVVVVDEMLALRTYRYRPVTEEERVKLLKLRAHVLLDSSGATYGSSRGWYDLAGSFYHWLGEYSVYQGGDDMHFLNTDSEPALIEPCVLKHLKERGLL